MSNQYPGSPGDPSYGNQQGGGAPGGGWDPQQPSSQPSAPQFGQPASQPSAPPPYGQPSAPQFGQPASQPSAPQYGQPASQPSAPQYGQPASQPSAPQFGQQPPAGGYSGSPTTQMGGAYGTPTTQMGTAYDSGVTWQQGAPVAPPPPKKSNTGKVLLFVGIGVVVLALIIGGVAFWNYQQGIEADKKVVQSATDTVQGYLDAVVAGDAEKALGFAATKPTGPLLTNEVAQKAAKDAAIGGVVVEPAVAEKNSSGKWTTATVHATYTVDNKPVSRDFPLTRTGDKWTIDKVTAKVQLGTTTIPFTINGAKVTGTSLDALPGKYTVASGNEIFEFTNASFTVTEPGAQVKWLADAEPTEKALSDAKDVLVKSFADCLAETSNISRENCPFGFKAPDGVSVDAGSVRFTVAGDPFAGAKFTKVSDTIYSVSISPVVTIKATGKRGNDAITLSGTTRFSSVGSVELGTQNFNWERRAV